MDTSPTHEADSRPEIFDLGERPPLGVVPEKMHAFCVRQDRFGEPERAWQREVIPTPALGPKDVLVYVMATGINYNNVWAPLSIAGKKFRKS
jgi:crotonyl-CoA carboxylase/reductase